MPLIFWVLAPILLLGTARGQTTRTVTHRHLVEQDSSQQLIQAETAIERHDYTSAEPLLQKVVLTSPGNYQAWFDLGFVFHALGKIDDSVAAYRKSVTAGPNIFESNLNLGLTLAQLGRPDAEQFLRAATHLKPTAHVEEGRARAWLSLAHLIESASPNEALEAYRQAATLQPDDPEPHLAAALLLEKQSRLDDALKEYSQASILDPSSTEAMAGLANVNMRKHLFPQAEEILKRLVTLHPKDGIIRTQLGRVLAAEGKTEDAISEMQAGIKLSPADSQAQRDLADLYAKSGKYGMADGIYRVLVEHSPTDPELRDDLGKALLEEHKFVEAQQEFSEAVRLKPDFGAAYGDLAAAASETKNYDLAIKAADARAKYLPEIPASYFLRATAYDHIHDKKRAALNYHQFLDAAKGQFPDQEWQARQRLVVLEGKR